MFGYLMTVELEGKCRKVNKIIIFYRSQFIFSQDFKLWYFVTILEMRKIKDRCDCWSCIHSKNLEFATAIVVDDHFLTLFAPYLLKKVSFSNKQSHLVIMYFTTSSFYNHIHTSISFLELETPKTTKVIFWQNQSRGNDWSRSRKQ